MLDRNTTPLAWRNFSHSRARLVGSLAGVTFAVILMFVEMGFLNGLYDNHTRFVDQLDADLLIVNADKEAVIPLQPFPRRRLFQVRGQPGVAAAYGLRLEEMHSFLKNDRDGHQYPIMILGFDPAEPVFLIPEVRAAARLLTVADTVLVDSRAKDFYGDRRAGYEAEISGRRMRIVGTYPLGPDFRVDGTAIVSERTFLNLFPDPRTGETLPDRIEFGLVKLVPGASLRDTRRALESVLPDDVRVLTKAEFSGRIRTYWGASKPVGYVFGTGMVVGFLIGVTICYQILYTGILDHLPQYATIKAIGYDDAYLVRLVVEEALYLGAGGFVPGLLLSAAIYAALQMYTSVPMHLSFTRMTVVFVLTIAMCVVSALIAVRKAIEADPADVF
jgi:putative ABC transport system permease protein